MTRRLVHDDGRVAVWHGDCRDVLPTLPPFSVDAVVCDSPYELGFMGRAWDASGIAYDVAVWAECLRVLKPGGHLLAFGGTRTSHRLTCAIEDAGFEIRDTITWLYGSGFPKSLDVSKAIDKAAGATEDAARWDGWGTALKPASEPIVVARKPLTGTVAANVLAHGTGALNIAATRVGTGGQLKWASPRGMGYHGGADSGRGEALAAESGRWPANVVLTHPQADGGDACVDGCVPDCPVAELDAQSGNRPAGGVKRGVQQSGRWGGLMGAVVSREMDYDTYGDQGGASRFFPTFRYEAKADTAQRPRAGDIAHPTVKPLALMRWLVRLVTPPGGTVLDHFAGSGTTGEACLLEGFDSILIEREPDYLPLILDRLTKRTDPVAHLTAKARRGENIDLGLFADLEGA